MIKEKKWTYDEFVRFVAKKVVTENPEFDGFLDYCQAHFDVRDDHITSDDTAIKTTTTFGGNEGVYADLIFAYPYNGTRLGTAKTLQEGDDAFRKMSRFACEFALAFNSYIQNNPEEFNYEGFSVGKIMEDGTISWRLWSDTSKIAILRAQEWATKNNATYVVRNNATREIVKEIVPDI